MVPEKPTPQPERLPDSILAIKKEEVKFLEKIGTNLPEGGSWRIQNVPKEDKLEEELVQVIPLPSLEENSIPDWDLVKPFLVIHYRRLLGHVPTTVSISEVRATVPEHTYAERSSRYLGGNKPEDRQYALSVIPIWDQDTREPDIAKNRLKTIRALNNVLAVEDGKIEQSVLAKNVLDEGLDYQTRSKALHELHKIPSHRLLTEAVSSRLYQIDQKTKVAEADQGSNNSYLLFKEVSSLGEFLADFGKENADQNFVQITAKLVSYVRNHPISGQLLIEELSRTAIDLSRQAEEVRGYSKAKPLKEQSDRIFKALFKALNVEQVFKNLDLSAIPSEVLKEAATKLDRRGFNMSRKQHVPATITMTLPFIFVAFRNIDNLSNMELLSILSGMVVAAGSVGISVDENVRRSPRFIFLKRLYDEMKDELARRRTEESTSPK